MAIVKDHNEIYNGYIVNTSNIMHLMQNAHEKTGLYEMTNSTIDYKGVNIVLEVASQLCFCACAGDGMDVSKTHS